MKQIVKKDNGDYDVYDEKDLNMLASQGCLPTFLLFSLVFWCGVFGVLGLMYLVNMFFAAIE